MATPNEVAAHDQARAVDRDRARWLADAVHAHLRDCRHVGCVGPVAHNAVTELSCDDRDAVLFAALVLLAGDDPRGEPDVVLTVRRHP